MTLLKHDYVDVDRIGRMIRLYCKVCGTLIGEDRDGQFLRFPNYGELKMQFTDGDMHVTQLCLPCIPRVVKDPKLLNAMYHADLDDMVKTVPQLEAKRAKFGPKVVAVNTKRTGIP